MVNKTSLFVTVSSGFDQGKRAYDPLNLSDSLDVDKKPVTDPTLTNPRCVFQLMKNFYSPLHPGDGGRNHRVPRSSWPGVGAIYSATGSPVRPGSCSTPSRHPTLTGVQIIRGYTILQQLLGDMGMPGGGINALRR